MKRFVCAAFAVLVLALFAHAGVIVDTFGPNYGVGNTAWSVNRVPYPESVAAPFTLSSDVTVTQLDLGFYAYAPVSNHIEVDLANDHWGLPGSIIESWNLQFVGYQQYISTVLANAHLHAGSQYWITVSATDDQTQMGWFYSYYNLQGPVGFDNGSGWWVAQGTTVSAFDVIGVTTVPEPGSLGLLGAAALGMAGVLRRKILG